jgi:hypothetical protein
MARHIWVSREADGERLYDEPLGSEWAVRESWSEPAAALGLPLLASIYDYGFYHGIRWSGPELKQVLEELDRRESHWKTSRLPSDVLSDLIERAGYLREAVRLAQQCRGLVDIS